MSCASAFRVAQLQGAALGVEVTHRSSTAAPDSLAREDQRITVWWVADPGVDEQDDHGSNGRADDPRKDGRSPRVESKLRATFRLRC